MGVTQYIGARYVPFFAEPAEWNNTRTYEPLTIVLHEGNSYTSKQYVPVGKDISATDFWVLTGNYNAQVEQYRKDVVRYATQVNAVTAALNAEITRAMEAEKKNADAITAETMRAKDTEKKNADAITAETMRAVAAENELFSTPEYYGAVGDGVTDDTEAIEKALGSGKTIIFTKRYKVNKALDMDSVKSNFWFARGSYVTPLEYAPKFPQNTDMDQTGLALVQNVTESVSRKGYGATGLTSSMLVDDAFIGDAVGGAFGITCGENCNNWALNTLTRITDKCTGSHYAAEFDVDYLTTGAETNPENVYGVVVTGVGDLSKFKSYGVLVNRGVERKEYWNIGVHARGCVTGMNTEFTDMGYYAICTEGSPTAYFQGFITDYIMKNKPKTHVFNVASAGNKSIAAIDADGRMTTTFLYALKAQLGDGHVANYWKSAQYGVNVNLSPGESYTSDKITPKNPTKLTMAVANLMSVNDTMISNDLSVDARLTKDFDIYYVIRNNGSEQVNTFVGVTLSYITFELP